MRKQVRFVSFAMALMLSAFTGLSGQDYHFTEGFAESGTPAGWEVKDVAYSSSATNAANMVDTAAHYCAKMKTNNTDSWLQAPKVNGAGTFSFWCKVKDAALGVHVSIQASVNGETWIDVAVDPEGIDLANDTDFQHYSVDINKSGAVMVRIYVISDTPGDAAKGTLTVDDVQLTKPEPMEDDVTLAELTVGGELVTDFDFAVHDYTMDIAINADYEVAAVPNNPAAMVDIEQITSITGTEEQRTATVTVTGEDGISKATTTVLINRMDYFWQEGFGDVPTGTCSLEGWEANHIYQSSNSVPPGAQNLYPGSAALKFTGGHETGSITDPGTLKSPKIRNVGTLTFWVALQKQVGGESLTVTMKKGFGMPTELWKMDSDLPTSFQEVVIEINETDSIEIMFEAICDINDDADNRIWIDDLKLTGITTAVPSFRTGPAVSLYPNPAGELLHIGVPDNAYNHVELFSITGQQVMMQTLESGQTSLNVGNLSQGIYMISFTGKSGKFISKFIKE